MSMAGGLRQSQSVLHTWSGLLVGWVLYLVFIAGTAAYWKDELTRWMQPEAGLPATPLIAVDHAQRFLLATAADATRWHIDLPGARGGATSVRWQPQGQDAPRRGQPDPYQAQLDAHGAVVQVRETQGGNFFYRLHFDLHHVPVLWARWFVCICAMFMLVAIVSGIITHKKIFADFFTLRRGKHQRSWMDGHNALAVLSLPFHLMITYTGLITLMTLYMPWAVNANYPGGRDAFFAELLPRAGKVERSGTAVVTPSLAQVLQRAELHWNGRAGSIQVEQPGDAALRIRVHRQPADRIAGSADTLTFDAQGERVGTTAPRSAAVVTRDGMIGLHAARFAPTAMRWLFFLSGVAGTLMVATGLVLWTVKRRTQLADPQRPHLGLRIVERLNIGFIAGLPVAMLAFLWGNRLLPPGMAQRADAEISVFFHAWAVCLLHAVLRTPRRAWVEQLAVAALLALGLPVYNALAWHGGLFTALAAGDGALAGVDIALLLLGTALLWAARKVQRQAPAPPRAPRRGATPAAAS